MFTGIGSGESRRSSARHVIFYSVLFLFAPSEESDLRFLNGSVVRFASVPFQISEPATFLNASIVYWEADLKNCDELLAKHQNSVKTSRKTSKVGLFTHNYPKCFPDDIARIYKDIFDFILIGRDNYYKPTGMMVNTRRLESQTPIPVYETDLQDLNVFPNEFSTSKVDIFPVQNPYKQWKIIIPYALISLFAMGLNIAKLSTIYKRLYSHINEQREVTTAVVLLVIEALCSVFSMFDELSRESNTAVMLLFVDYNGLFGVYSSRVFYPFIQIPSFLSNASTLMLLYAFNVALKDVELSETSYNVQMGVSSVFLAISLFPAVYDSYAFITRQVKTSPVVSALNVFSIMYFSGVLSFLFIKAKKRVVTIFEGTKDGLATAQQKRIERMSEFMYYAATCMIGYLLLGMGLGAALATASGFGAVFLLGVAEIMVTMVGFTQVLSLPEKPGA